METKFTPGPWIAGKYMFDADLPFVDIYADEAPIGLKLPAMAYGEKAEANAHLIAAAPDMYAALEDIARGKLQGPGNFETYVIAIAEKVLAKARGE